MKACYLLTCVSLTAALPALAGTDNSDAEAKSYSLHFQTTVIDQAHSRFHAPYSGRNSLQPDPESATSVTSTLFAGWSPLQGTSFFLNPELAGGRGMSGAVGVAGFPNGETFRIGSPQPAISIARAFVQQVFGFGAGKEKGSDGPNQLCGELPTNRLTLVGGKFSIVDYFDNNAYSHDPRTQFMNWALMDSAAWDYPADTRGYTWGLMTEFHAPAWAARAAAVAEPKGANGPTMDRRISRAHGFAVEGERSIEMGKRKGALRLLVFANEAHMGNYDESLAFANRTAATPDIALTRAYGHTKYGIASSDDLELTDHLGGFLRLSWDDGHNETWAFTEVDDSAALGIDWNPAAWNRPKDHWGLAEVVNGLSPSHRRYLANGGLGFLIGDGALHYGPEMITETYYKIQLNDMLALSPDAQFVVNPAYNRARGPVPIWGVRAHAEF